jgi:streptogramin lyase
MRTRAIALSVVTGLILAGTLTLGFILQARAAGTVQDMELNPNGEAYEINVGASGRLWISDYVGDEIRVIHPGTGVYTTYQASTPSDARPDGAGSLWWSDTDSHLLRLVLATGQVTSWTLPVSGFPLGTAVDQDGDIWLSDSTESLLYRFDPGTTELCSFTLPDGGNSNYITADGENIWLSDYVASRLMRLEPASNTFTLWDLPWSSYVNGIEVDGDGDVWIAESDEFSLLAEFDPQINQLNAYTVPYGIWPEMLAFLGDSVWYTEDIYGTIGVLDPASADSGAYILDVSSEQVAPSCAVLGAGSTAPAVTSSGTHPWASSMITNEVDIPGWSIYTLPENGTPWGITVLGDDVYVVDQGRQMLMRISAQEDTQKIYLPVVIK